MKKLIVTGMVLLSTSFASAAGKVAKSPRELLTDYTKIARDAMFGKGKTASSLDANALNGVKKKLVDELGMPELHTAMSGAAATARVDYLVSIVAAKKMAVELKNNAATVEEGKSIESAAKASAKLIANSPLLGAKKSADLNSEQVTLVRDSIQKAESLATDILLKFSKAERDSYTKVLEKYDELNQTSSKSAEENFVAAIMEIKGVDRAKALEIVKKLKECV